MKHVIMIAFAWWFWATDRGLATIGPFVSRDQCESYRLEMANHGILTSKDCWESHS